MGMGGLNDRKQPENLVVYLETFFGARPFWPFRPYSSRGISARVTLAPRVRALVTETMGRCFATICF